MAQKSQVLSAKKSNMDEYPFSLLVKYSKELSQKQEREQWQYFSVKRRSSGGECLVTKLSPTQYRVSYKKKEVLERVLNYSDHKNESCGEPIEFTLQAEEIQEKTNVADSEEKSNVGASAAFAMLEKPGSSENVLAEQETSIFLDSDCQYAVIRERIADEILTIFPCLKITCESRLIKLTGHGDLKQARHSIKNMINSVKEHKVVVSPAIASFLLSWDNIEISKRLIPMSREGHVILDTSRGFRLYAPSDALLNQAEIALQQNLKEERIQFAANGKLFLDSLQNDRDILLGLEEDCASNSLMLSLVGFTQAVEKILNACKLFLCKKAIINEEIDLEHNIIVENLDDILRCFGTCQVPATVQVIKSSGQTLTMIGPRDDVNTSKAVFLALKKLHVDNLCISKHGAVHFLKKEGQEMLKKLQEQFKCCIFICDSESGEYNAESTSSVQNVPRVREDNVIQKAKLKVASTTSFDKRAQQTEESGSSKRPETPKENQLPVIQLVLNDGKLENKKADVLVAPLLSNSPNLQTMNVTKDLKQRGGDRFANLFLAALNSRTALDSGSIFELPVPGESYPLDCDLVIFIACLPWNGPNGSSCMALKRGVRAMLENCNSRNQSSVAMSVIGPGKKLGFPEETAAKLIGEEIKSFVESTQNLRLKKIELVIPMENQTLYFIYRETLLHMNLGDRIIFCNENGGSFRKISFGEHDQVSVNNMSIVVAYNNIATETTDAIVNSTNFIQWGRESVAHTIFTTAGPNIIRDAKSGANSGASRQLVLTGPGALPCKWIIHCDCNNKIENIPNLAKDILLRCESVGLTSVAIPAMGTGECGFNPAEVARLFMNAILSLVRTRRMTCLTCVRLVTFHPHIYYIFCAELKHCFRSLLNTRNSWNPMELLTSRLKSQWFPDCDAINDLKDFRHPVPVPPAVLLVIVADLANNAEVVKCYIKEEFDKQYKEVKIEQALLQTFSLEEIQNVFSVVKETPEVEMILDRDMNCIMVNGCEKNVFEVAMKVQTKLNCIITARLQNVTIEKAGLLVQWGYSDVDGSHPFTIGVSQILEDKYQAGKKETVTVKLENDKKVKVNLDTMKATLEGATRIVTIIRWDLKNENQLPEHWDDMNGLQFMTVELDCNSEEYNNVKISFNRTVNRPIVKIERIQNKYQHIAYTLRKEYMSEKNGPEFINERSLFHGTAPQNCHSINYSGFNRSFAGQNAVSFGNGVYFAVNASYSVNETYSPTDPNTREKFMYLAKVLLGHYTLGRAGMKTPPSRQHDNPCDLYDSLANNQNNPTIFVVFHDDQVYPEYLITFK